MQTVENRTRSREIVFVLFRVYSSLVKVIHSVKTHPLCRAYRSKAIFKNTQNVFWVPGLVLITWSQVLDLTMMIIWLAQFSYRWEFTFSSIKRKNESANNSVARGKNAITCERCSRQEHNNNNTSHSRCLTNEICFSELDVSYCVSGYRSLKPKLCNTILFQSYGCIYRSDYK